MHRRLGVDIESNHLAACVGTKELVAGLPHLLRLRTPTRDTVLYPAISYPSYAMGATLAGARAVAVPVDDQWRLSLDAIDASDAERALCLWVNTPGNPAGGLDDLGAAAAWARANDVPLFSDECYVEFTWDTPDPAPFPTPGRSVLQHGIEGVVAVHSLSKRSNLAGLRSGFYAGDPDIVAYLSETRRHGGLMPPGPAQTAAVRAFDDDDHVDAQRVVYHNRLERMAGLLRARGLQVDLPGGGFYLWIESPDGDGWTLADRLARELGVVGSPGELYGAAGAAYCRLAMVQPDEAFDLIERRVTARPSPA